MTDRIDRSVSDEGLAAAKARTAPPADDARKPDSPSDLTAGSWRYAVKQAWAEFRRDECTDLAAALTYYAVLSMFPALLAVVALLGVFGRGSSTTDTLLELVERIGQQDAVDQLRQPITQMTEIPSRRFRRRVRAARRGVERVGLRRRVRPGDEQDLRSRRGSAVLEAAPAQSRHHGRRRRAGGGRAARPRRDRTVRPGARRDPRHR